MVLLKDLLPSIGVSVDEDKPQAFAEAGIKRLLSFQTDSGGLSYWPGGRTPHAFGTAFGLTALIEAKRRGFDVPDSALAEMATYMERVLRRPPNEEMPHGAMRMADTQALLILSLGRMGRKQDAEVSVLWRRRSELSAFGLALLAVAVKEGSGDPSLLSLLLREVRRAARESADEAFFDGRAVDEDGFGSALRTHAGALLAFAVAGSNLNLSQKFLQGLLRRRRFGLWGNTQENVFGIMGVATAEGVARAGGTSARPARADNFALWVDGQSVPVGEMEILSPATRRYRSRALADETKAAETRIEVQSGGKNLKVVARASFDVRLDAASKAPQARGFRIERRVEMLAGKPLDKTIPSGAVVRVRLLVHAETEQSYVALDDRLPAGLEPMNQALATTERVEAPSPSAEARAARPYLSHQEMRDARVSFYFDRLPMGRYEVSYLATATTPGRFRRPAARVEAMYRPERYGTTEIDAVEIR